MIDNLEAISLEDRADRFLQEFRDLELLVETRDDLRDLAEDLRNSFYSLFPSLTDRAWLNNSEAGRRFNVIEARVRQKFGL